MFEIFWNEELKEKKKAEKQPEANSKSFGIIKLASEYGNKKSFIRRKENKSQVLQIQGKHHRKQAEESEAGHRQRTGHSRKHTFEPFSGS